MKLRLAFSEMFKDDEIARQAFDIIRDLGTVTFGVALVLSLGEISRTSVEFASDPSAWRIFFLIARPLLVIGMWFFFQRMLFYRATDTSATFLCLVGALLSLTISQFATAGLPLVVLGRGLLPLQILYSTATGAFFALLGLATLQGIHHDESRYRMQNRASATYCFVIAVGLFSGAIALAIGNPRLILAVTLLFVVAIFATWPIRLAWYAKQQKSEGGSRKDIATAMYEGVAKMSVTSVRRLKSRRVYLLFVFLASAVMVIFLTVPLWAMINCKCLTPQPASVGAMAFTMTSNPPKLLPIFVVRDLPSIGPFGDRLQIEMLFKMVRSGGLVIDVADVAQEGKECSLQPANRPLLPQPIGVENSALAGGMATQRRLIYRYDVSVVAMQFVDIVCGLSTVSAFESTTSHAVSFLPPATRPSKGWMALFPAQVSVQAHDTFDIDAHHAIPAAGMMAALADAYVITPGRPFILATWTSPVLTGLKEASVVFLSVLSAQSLAELSGIQIGRRKRANPDKEVPPFSDGSA